VVRRLLVANRGEIALRVFRTCRARGIETVAVVAPDDFGSWHARVADQTAVITSYLDPSEHVRAARETGADAIHPGYGFLAESAAFAESVERQGLTWVGPPSAALRLGADKLAVKEAARAARVPVLPQGAPETVGLPLVVKAAAGGGGRGMRVVRSEAELGEALAAARREAQAAFGDATVFCERYLERPRHVEVQLVVDAGGHVLVLGERDCSVQRRHQKIVEETPPPGLHASVLERLRSHAIAVATAVGYRNAGTAEFLVDGDDVYFLELNGRIQVEHPVTEERYATDLVALQVWVAEGESLRRYVPVPGGHAIEARLYAEDPRTFLPQAGRIDHLLFPGGVRVDAGVEEGDAIGTSYDPMIAKLVAHAPTRAEALDTLAAALEETVVSGLTTNLPFLRWLVSHPSFREGRLSTAFLVDHPPLSPAPRRLPAGAWGTAWRPNLPPPPAQPPPDVHEAAHAPTLDAGGSDVTAPMPGTVLRVAVRAGERVEARQPLVVLEAMKMETPVSSPFPATVKAVHVEAGDQVAGGSLLVELEP
jgi:acetyl/propionyl-CoA carboxylase alpha subunit